MAVGLGQSPLLGHVTGAAILITLRSVLRLSGVDIFLTGLSTFCCQDLGSIGQPEVADSKTKKGRKQAAKRHVELKGIAEQNTFMTGIGPRSLHSITFSKDFNDVILTSAAILLNTWLAVMAALFAGSGAASTTSVNLFTLLVLGFSTFTVLKVDVTSHAKSSTAGDKLHLMVTAVLGSAAAAALLAPQMLRSFLQSSLGINVDEMIQSLDDFSQHLMRRVLSRMDLEDDHQQVLIVRSSGFMLTANLALCAGLIAAAMYGSAAKYARLVYDMGSPPSWGRKYIVYSRKSVLLARLGLVLPFIVVMLQFKSISTFWKLPVAWIPQIQAALMLLIVLVHALVLNPMAQAWLNSGLIEWYRLRHSGIEHPRKAEAVKNTLDLIRGLLGKTSVQIMGLACILTSAALLSGLHGDRGLITLASEPGSREYILSAGRKVLEAAGPMGHSLADQLAALAESASVIGNHTLGSSMGGGHAWYGV
ncbi:hypothetical protein CEUSTIGMA_g9265.t1 [Chlamydomonas eustigma]|uniref:Uncharacterized protein n=1 Tax=Chlamydomonas eustigma TaxID=1157962 RepID=A0A250XFI7_9CHLO|nr:hypothetical protein CEUSTIGMA_g9265.t1 [Chlamydomonas eustigma]|eukprot:GAX81837.1 hypothetical protein CEUSTIGMA_g9265.t1 [Chlamydomonas eustigma]